ncbi:DNA cytosine methyltransferase [Flavobacteriaceae bacterium 14752]|uniref:DNA cytosine methyltransferase n=1 Tax=Mesohalobacter salilacus TaxID=2491711 RepID=UPI000F63470B|nr:DNA cytosine methyltransferase [Flavobacteriaceae bacterium 14752]
MTHGSLFSGIGGFDLASKQVGFKNIFHCEIIEYKRKTLIKNFPNTKTYADIQNFEGQKYKDKIDILSGGFPCQDVSIAQQSKKINQRDISGKRTGLWQEYARVIREIEPGIVIFENSPMLLIRGFEKVLCDFHKLGYDVEWRCFFASDFGYPHFRKRLYGVAYSRCKRWKNTIKKGGVLQKVLPKKTPRQIPLSIPIKRFNGNSSYEDVRMDDGFSKELDKNFIHGFGNAVIPEIPYQIFYKLKNLKT